MAITIYEALMAFRIGECLKDNLESFRKIDDLFKGYTRSVDFIKMVRIKLDFSSSFFFLLIVHCR